MKINQKGASLDFISDTVFCFYDFKDEKTASQFKTLYEQHLLNPKFKKSDINISTIDGDIKVGGYIIENTNLAVHKYKNTFILDYIPTGQYITCNFNSRKQALIGSVEQLALVYDKGFDIFNENDIYNSIIEV